MINNPTCLQTFQTGKSSTFTTIQPGQAWPEFRTTDAVPIQKGNKNNTVQQLCVTEMATPALGFTGTIVEKEKAASCVVSVVLWRGNTVTAGGSNPTSRLLLEHVNSVFIFHFQLLRERQGYSTITLVRFGLPPFLAASFIYICACEAKAAVIRISYLKWQVSVCVMSTSLCDTVSPEAVYLICFNSSGTADRVVLQWKCSCVMCAVVV